MSESGMTSAEHLRICPLCEAMCGLRIPVSDEGEIGTIRADRDDPWSRGHLCPKGTTLGHLHRDPDRLRRPLVRGADGELHDASWDQAWEAVERVLRPVIDSSGLGAVTVYAGNPIAHNLALGAYVGALVGMGQAMGMGPIYSAGTVDQWPVNVVSALLYGRMWTIPVPDLARADHLWILGANPAASQGSLLATADVMGQLAALRASGGRLTVFDPRRTGTALTADEWVPIRPGSDALFLLAVLHVIGRDDLVVRPARLEGRVSGLDEVLALAREFPPATVASACGIAADDIERLARALAAARRPAVYGRIGTCTQEFGTLATWLIAVLNVAIGALDAPGGMCFPESALWSPLDLKPPDQTSAGWEFGRTHSRVRGAPEVLGQYPVSCLAEEILTPGEGRIRALVTLAGNPAVSAPAAGRLTEALGELDAMISIDNWCNETTRHADVILPGLSPLESPHHDDLLWKFATGSALRWSDPVVEPEAGRPFEWEVILRLAGTLLGTPCPDVDTASLDDLYVGGLVATLCATDDTPLTGRDPDQVMAALADGSSAGRGPERLLDLGIRLGPWGDGCGGGDDRTGAGSAAPSAGAGGLTLADAKRHPRGLVLGDLEPNRLDEVVKTPSGTVELDHPHLRADLDRLRRRLGEPAAELVLTSRRHLRSNNSWMHNVPVLVKGRVRCTLLIHPADAEQRRVLDGALVRVESSEGALVVPAEVTDEMMPGVVSLPHGWGHDTPGARLGVAAEHPGVNSNLLNPGALVDAPSGNAAVNGVPVDVTAV